MTKVIDRTTLKIALETDVWMAVYCAEPERLIDVQMRYKDLVAIRKLIVRYVEEQSKVDLIHPIRCRDCKHRPYKNERGHVIPPEEDEECSLCPCVDDNDWYYNYIPKDDWYCANGEPKDKP